MLGRSPVLCVIWQILYRPSDRQALFDRRVAAKASYNKCPNNSPLDNLAEIHRRWGTTIRCSYGLSMVGARWAAVVRRPVGTTDRSRLTRGGNPAPPASQRAQGARASGVTAAAALRGLAGAPRLPAPPRCPSTLV